MSAFEENNVCSSNEPPLILITGVSSYIGSWIAYSALKLGFRVRGTVRCLSDQRHDILKRRDFCPGSKFPLDLVSADLKKPEDWKGVVEGAIYVFHVASPVPLDHPRHPVQTPDEEVIQPAVDGTLNLLKALASSPSPSAKRVVVTSSAVAMMFGTKDPVNKVAYSDNDWTCTDSKNIPIDGYNKSKTMAEKAAWEFYHTYRTTTDCTSTTVDTTKFELCCVNTGAVFGPMLLNKMVAPAFHLNNIITADMPGIPDLYLANCSVQDMIHAHFKAMFIPEAEGKRFLVTQSALALSTVSSLLAAEFGKFGYSPTRMRAPTWLIKTVGGKQGKVTIPLLGKQFEFDPKNAKDILGMELAGDTRMVVDMAYAGIAAGIIPDKSKNQTITKNYIRPEPDLSALVPLATQALS